MKPILHEGKRVMRLTAGFGLLIVGAVFMIPGIPGPGFIPFFVGLSLLASDFAWARRLRERLKDGAHKIVDKVRGTR